MARQKKILFTARDIGAAQQIKQIIKFFQKNNYTVSIIASSPAYEAIREFGLTPTLYLIDNQHAYLDDSGPAPMKEKLLADAREVICKEKPDALFSGLTTLGVGIDEAVLFFGARLDIPSFQFLDSWGTFNLYEDGHPTVYFAIDQATVNIGKKMTHVPIHVVGSPKHYAYSLENMPSKRKNVRNSLGCKENEKLIGYFGQDPWTPGVTYNFERAVDALCYYRKFNKKNFKLLIRPHPTYEDRYDPYRRYLKKKGIYFIDTAAGYAIEDYLSACDLLLTCYSTVAVDHAFLSSYSDISLGTMLYTLLTDELKSYLQNHFGYWKSPLLDAGIGFYAESNERLREKIIALMEDPSQEDAYFRSSKVLKAQNPEKKIIDIVSRYL